MVLLGSLSGYDDDSYMAEEDMGYMQANSAYDS